MSLESFTLSNQVPEIKKLKPKTDEFSQSLRCLLIKLLQSGRITDPGTEIVLKQIIHASGQFDCSHSTCQQFNRVHHLECKDCQEECKNICLVETHHRDRGELENEGELESEGEESVSEY